MNCEEFENRLHQENLTEQEKSEMEEHAASCSLCRMKSDLKDLMPDEEIPESAGNAWRQAVLNEAGEKKVRKFPVWARLASIAASLVILAVGASRVGQMNLNSPAPAPVAAVSMKSTSVAPAYSGGIVPRSAEAYHNAAEVPAEEPEEDAMLFSMDTDDMVEEEFEYDEAMGASAANSITPESAVRTEKIIRNAVIQITTPDFDHDLSLVENVVNVQSGTISSSGTSLNPSGTRRAFLTARIPAENLDRYMESISSVTGRITQREISTQDVTEQYTDIRARLDNAIVKRDRLRELLHQAENISDLLQIEYSLSEAQSTVDYLTGRINSLDTDISYSTVSITLNEETPAQSVRQTDGSFQNRLKNGMELSLQSIWLFLQNLCLFLLMALPWLAVPAVIIVICLIYHKKAKRRKKNENDA